MVNPVLQADLIIMPKDCSSQGIPKLPCDSKSGDVTLSSLPLGMSVIPKQQFVNIIDPNTALQTGTIFQDLAKPFLGVGGNLI